MYSRVYIEITNICNMHCSFCHGHSRPRKQMQQAEFTRILDQLDGVTNYIYYHLMGEPLTHPELPEFLNLAAQRGFHSIITTNGTLLKKHQEELLNAKIHKISISLHSFEEGNQDSHLQYLQNCADFAGEAAAKGTIISFRLWNKGFDEGRNDTTLAALQQMLPGDWTVNSRGFRVRDKIFLEWGDRFEWPDPNAPLIEGPITCYGLRDQFGILCDGTVVPCCLDSDGNIPLGNIFHQELIDILASSRAQAMVQGFRCRKASEELCKRCGYATRFIK